MSSGPQAEVDGEPSTILFILHCISGPDLGNRLAIRETEITLGRSAQCNLLSDDQDVKECHVVFKMNDGRPTCQALADCMLMLDGHLVREATLLSGQQIRIGRFLWQIGVDSQDPVWWLASSIFRGSTHGTCFPKCSAPARMTMWKTTSQSAPPRPRHP